MAEAAGSEGGARPTVVVTGASSGIGESVASAWARRGATVVVSARGEEGLAYVAREVEAAGGRAIVERGDVTREEDRVRLVDRARAETGRLDVLVNNAGRGFYGSVARDRRCASSRRSSRSTWSRRSASRSSRSTR